MSRNPVTRRSFLAAGTALAASPLVASPAVARPVAGRPTVARPAPASIFCDRVYAVEILQDGRPTKRIERFSRGEAAAYAKSYNQFHRLSRAVVREMDLG